MFYPPPEILGKDKLLGCVALGYLRAGNRLCKCGEVFSLHYLDKHLLLRCRVIIDVKVADAVSLDDHAALLQKTVGSVSHLRERGDAVVAYRVRVQKAVNQYTVARHIMPCRLYGYQRAHASSERCDTHPLGRRDSMYISLLLDGICLSYFLQLAVGAESHKAVGGGKGGDFCRALENVGQFNSLRHRPPPFCRL